MKKMWKALLSMLLGKMGPLLQMILTTLTDKGTMDRVLELAKSEVAKLAGHDELDGPAKRKAAEAAILQDLKAIGLDVAGVVVNLAIEVAVAALKAQTAK